MNGGVRRFQGTSRYEVIRLVGQGGMGVVYEVRDRDRNLRLALKTLLAMSPDALYLFKQEFRALADLVHPNLVSLDELSFDGETWFFTMEFVDGTDFLSYVRPISAFRQDTADDHTRTIAPTATFTTDITGADLTAAASAPRRGPGTLAGVCDYQRLRSALRQLGGGLNALHEAGKLHRDIKPTNVMVGADGRCIILDFGLVFDFDASAETHIAVGTLAYMAPEQAAGQAIGPAADWYAVGITLFQAITGEFPFHGTGRELLRQKLQSDAPLASSLIADVPADLDQLCRHLLDRDPSHRPTGQDILRLLSADSPVPLPSPRPRSPRRALEFVGRTTELGALHEALAAAREGRAVIADVHGPSGAGKSALIQRFLEDASRGHGTLVLGGRCYEQESVPYKGVDSLIDALGGYLKTCRNLDELLPDGIVALAKIFPVLGWLPARAPHTAHERNSDPVEMRRDAFRCLREVLRRISTRASLVVYLDDLQWGDIDSAALLSELLRPPGEPALLLICSSRSEHADNSPCIQGLRSAAQRFGLRHDEIPVPPLEAGDALELASQILEVQGVRDASLANEIVRESGGNAYFLRELLANVAQGEERRGAGLSLDEVIWNRILALPEGARRLLEIVAVSGKPLAKADAYQAAGLPEEDPTLLASLRAAHFVRSTGPQRLDEVESFHDRVRETVLGKLAAKVLRERHLSLGVTFEATGRADAERLATHFDAGGNARKARRYYPTAASRASAALAFDHAVRLYRRALELEDAGSADPTLRREFADALANSGRGVEAAHVYEQLSRNAGGETALELQQKAAYQYCVGGLVEEGRTLFDEVIRRVGLPRHRTRNRVLAALLFQRLRLLLRPLRFHERPAAQVAPALLNRIDAAMSLAAGLSIVDVIEAIYFSTYAAHLALEAGEPSRLMRALSLQAAAVSAAGRAGRRKAERMLTICHDLAQRVNTPEARATVTLCEGLAAFNIGLWTRSLKCLRNAETMLRKECSGVAWELATTRNMLLQTLAHMGCYREILDHVSRLRDEVKERGDLYSATWMGCHVEPVALMAADRPAEARETIRAALGAWKQTGYHQQHYLSDVTTAQILLYEGDATGAGRHLRMAWPTMRKALILSHGPSLVYALDLLARCTLMEAAGRRDRRQPLAEAEKIASRIERGGWYDVGKVWGCAARACIASLRGQPEEALRLGEQAAERFAAMNMPAFAAAARRQTGLLRGGGQGREQVLAAETQMRDLGVADPARWAAVVLPGL